MRFFKNQEATEFIMGVGMDSCIFVRLNAVLQDSKTTKLRS